MSDRVDDAAVVARAELGDREAFDLLVSRYYTAVVSAAYLVLGDFEAARDCAQQAFTVAVANLSTLRDKSKFSQWIYGIARQQAIYVIRKQKRHSEAIRIKTDESRASIPAISSPSEQAGRKERLEYIRKALGQVPEIYREVLVLKYIDGRSHEDIAALLDISLAAVDKRLMRGKDMLRESLKSWSTEG